ncbi:hypothetical protein [uncultured Prevotella sp.]|uniref:hypothetical protein n=1 Tax=uncultured Prevotella sp. TaxID=159272 RepID=UPI0025DE6396|nr:hypothetical protein [uncultured Prevotella sp.]
MNTVLDDKEKRKGVVTQPGVVAPGVLAQPQQPANVFSGKRPTTFENMPVNVGWSPYGKPVNEGSNVQQSWQTSNPKNTEGRMPAAYALGGVDLGAVGGDKGVTAVFEKDDSQRDGGFFKWLGGLSKKRPGRREGESDDDYDERMTRNNMRIATLADAIRHMGNIYNTSKGAALQKFNNPTAEMQADLDKRKAERARKAAAEADAAYKNANLQIKMDAADADRAYKNLALGIREKAQKLAEDRFGHQKGKDEHNAKLADDKFAYKKEQDKIKNDQTDRRIAISAKRAAKSGSGRGGKTSGGKYWFVDKSGKMRYQPNKTMWEQEYYREYGALPHGESSTSVSTKAYNSKGEEVTTTQRKKGPSMTSQAAQQQNKARASRKNNAKPKKRGWASGFKL